MYFFYSLRYLVSFVLIRFCKEACLLLTVLTRSAINVMGHKLLWYCLLENAVMTLDGMGAKNKLSDISHGIIRITVENNMLYRYICCGLVSIYRPTIQIFSQTVLGVNTTVYNEYIVLIKPWCISQYAQYFSKINYRISRCV